MMPIPSLAQSVQPRGFPRGPLAPGILQSYPGLALGTLFDGVNDYAEVTGLGRPAPNEFTAMGWITGSAFGVNRVFDCTAGASSNGLEIFILSASFRVTSYGPTGTNTGAAFGPSLSTGRRYHVAVVASAGNITQYVDGARVGVTSIPVGNRPDALVRMRFGLSTGGGNPFSGSLAAWSVYQRALSDAEIVAAAARRAVYPSLDAALAVYPFDQLGPSATQSPDISGNARHLALVNMPANPIVSF
jgi:hypothetical protein